MTNKPMLVTEINDANQAKEQWLKRKLDIDESGLFDYDRPLKEIRTKSLNPFQKKVVQYGFAGAVMRYVLP